MTKYVIYANSDRTESSMFPKDHLQLHLDSQKHLRKAGQSDSVLLDVDHNPMMLLYEFEAETWEEAKEKQEVLMGWKV